jgi:hypothetical protein
VVSRLLTVRVELPRCPREDRPSNAPPATARRVVSGSKVGDASGAVRKHGMKEVVPDEEEA